MRWICQRINTAFSEGPDLSSLVWREKKERWVRQIKRKEREGKQNKGEGRKEVGRGEEGGIRRYLSCNFSYVLTLNCRTHNNTASHNLQEFQVS